MAKTSSELEDLVLCLSEAGVDIFHCSSHKFFEPEFEGSNLSFSGWVKKITKKTTIAVGGIGLDNTFADFSQNTIEMALQRLARQEFDLLAGGRILLANPDWAKKIQNGNYKDIIQFSESHINNFY